MTSPVVAVCPHCEKRIKVKKPELIGKKVKCPGCSQPFRLQPEQPAEETYSISQEPDEKPQTPSGDDEWLSALGEAAQSGQPLESPQTSAGLPPKANKPKKKKKKPREFGPEPVPGSDDDDRYGYGVEEGMSKGLIGAIIGGVIAGTIGALIWGGIAYGTGYEVGYVAWGIGAMVGFGVLLGAQEYAGVTSGIIALVLANLSIFAGKVFAVWMLFNAMFANFDIDVSDFEVTDQDIIHEIAYDITEERRAAGEELLAPREDLANYDFSADYPADLWKQAEQRWQNMPPREKAEWKSDAGADVGESYLVSMMADEILFERMDDGQDVEWPEVDPAPDYPPGIWEAAEAQWAALSPEEKQKRKVELQGDFEDFNLMDVAGPSLIQITWQTLGPLDGLWIILASFTAFRIGANEHEED